MSDFYSGYGRTRKPYVPIDTYSPAGTWIEEKHYNRVRPSGSNGRKVLCGNWQEEQALEQDMLQRERDMQATLSATTGSGVDGGTSIHHGTTQDTVSLDVIRDRGNGTFAGGFESTPYLTCDAVYPNMRCMATTHRTDYTKASSDVTQLRRPELGVRSRVLLQQALAAAAEEQKMARERQAGLSSSATRFRRGRSGFSGTADADSDVMQDDATVHTQSVYKTTICDPDEVLPTVDVLQSDYLSDEPITLYTGNPATNTVMAVHGKTPVDTSGPNQFGKHSYFSEPKYHL